MNGSKIRVLALDLDGTLTNDEKIVTPRTRAALDAAAAQGVTIVLASGRPTAGITPLAKELGLDALVEVHDEAEMERALKLDAKIIGVNNRNLKDFSIDLHTTERLSRMVPQGKLLVAESGIVSDEDVEFLKACGVNAFLIGRAFMEAEHPGEVAARWKQR